MLSSIRATDFRVGKARQLRLYPLWSEPTVGAVVSSGEDAAFRTRLGWLLADVRIALGMTQAEAAELAEVAEDTLRRWEAGETMPRFGDLARLVARYELPEKLRLMLFDPPEDSVVPVLALLGDRVAAGFRVGLSRRGRRRVKQ